MKPCSHPECRGLSRCIRICPEDAVSLAGVSWDSDALAEKLLASRAIFDSSGGGVTLSGGEPLLQWEFAEALLRRLKGQVHTAVETSGFAPSQVFCKIVGLADFVFMDIKLADPELHKKYTGVPNGQILKNAEYLKSSGVPHCFRTPLIPGITDTEENLSAIGKITEGSKWEKLPYNRLAPAKYKSVGRAYPLAHVE